MRTVRLIVAYDGSAYAGWQFQTGERSLQETIETAIAKVTGQSTRVMASGRTDAGVHALGQVVGFRTHCALAPEVLCRALNAHLPRDVVVLDAADAPEGFHATIHAKRKRYRYVIDNHPVRDAFQRHYTWHYPVPLDVEAMDRAAQCLVGTHDFRSFQTSGSERKTSVRTVFEVQSRRGEGAQHRLVRIEIEANGFLYNMVRTIVGSLVRIGRGARPESWLAEVLAAMDRRVAGPTAPPQGLFLVCVDYGSDGSSVANP